MYVSLDTDLSILKAGKLHLNRCSDIIKSAAEIIESKSPLKFFKYVPMILCVLP